MEILSSGKMAIEVWEELKDLGKGFGEVYGELIKCLGGGDRIRTGV